MDRTTPIGRYSRQILFAPIGASGQKRLSASRVAVVGLGALGTVLANHMVRAGVGFVRLIDRDFVEESNLQRQMLYDERDAEEGLPKAAAAARHLADFNRDVRLEPVIADLTWRNAESLLGDVDIILDGTDNFEVRYLVNDVAVKRGIPWIYGGAVAAHGVVLPVLPGDGPCLRCLFPEAPAPGEAPTCDTAGVIGPVVHVVASLQGTEALKMLVGDRKAIRRRLVYLDLWENRWSETDISRSRRPDCPCCGARRFDWLSPRTDDAVSLCGRQAIQVTLGAPLDLERLERRLAPLGQVRRNPFLLRFQIEDKRLTVFPDGRVLVQGTDDPAAARSLCARYIGG